MMGMKRPKKSSESVDAEAIEEHGKVVDAAEAAKAEKDEAKIDAALAEMKANAAKAVERLAVLDRLADEIINARNAHGGEAVFLRDIKCK